MWYNICMRTCIKCSEVKPLDQFTKGKGYKDGRRNWCKSCDAARMRKYFSDNPEKYEANKRIDRARRANYRRHSLSIEEYNELLSRYDGKCYVCQIAEATHIDHDHNCCNSTRYTCGKCVRGILCRDCNLLLGNAKDRVDTLSNAVLYLTSQMR